MKAFFPLILLITTLQAKIISPTIHTLKNGLQVVFIQNQMAPVVSVGVLYKVGTADDPADQIGLSHFLEHMMFKGTKKYPGPQYSEIIKDLGGFSNAYTSYDYTYYVTDIPTTSLVKVLELEADRMENLSFDEQKDFVPEKKVVQQERLMRMDNSPYTEALEAYLKALYWYHPYGVPPIGYPHHIENYTYNAIMNHYKIWYKPNNAVLVIVGSFDEAQILKQIDAYFSSIKQGVVPDRKRPQEPDHKGVTVTIEQINKRNANTILVYSYKKPAKLENGEFEALCVLCQILSGDSTSPVNKDLIIDQKLALEVGFSAPSYSLDDDYLSFQANLSPEQTSKTSLKKFESILKNWLQTFMEKTISESFVEEAKKQILNPQIFIKDNRAGIRELFSDLASGQTINGIITEDERIQKVTLKMVKDVYAKYLSKKPDVVLKLYPENEKVPLKKISIWEKLKSFFKS